MRRSDAESGKPASAGPAAGQRPSASRTKEPFADIIESRALLGGSMRGRKVVFVVDDRDFRAESLILRMSVFESSGAHPESSVMKYSEFYASPGFSADALVLRSSRIFESHLKELRQSLSDFRAANPGSAVILCAFDFSVAERIQDAADSGLVDRLDPSPPDDYRLLFHAAQILESRRR